MPSHAPPEKGPLVNFAGQISRFTGIIYLFMETNAHRNRKSIARGLFVYLGSAWVFIEALNFLIDKYYWNSRVLDILIILVIFGLPAMLIYLWFNNKFPTKAIILHSVNLVIALTVITLGLIKPNLIDPSQIRLLKFQDQQEKLAISVRSLAILPFSNYTETKNQESLVAGLHDALIGEFGQIGGIRVISKTSTLPYANSQKTIREIASELKVDAIIETSVLSLDRGIRIQVKLINASPEMQLWTRNFDSSIDNVMDLYNQIVKNIANEIHLALTPHEKSSLENAQLVNPEAYRAYLEGKFQSELLTESGFQNALKSFQRSLEVDSTFAPAYGGMAFAWIGALQMRHVPVAQAIPEIYKNNLRALALDPDYPEAQYINGLMSFQAEWDWQKSEAAFRKAIEGNPNHVLSHAFFSHVLLTQKRFEEAFEEIDKAVDLDPGNPLVLSLYGVILWHHGDLDRAIEVAKTVQEMNAFSPLLYVILDASYYHQGDYRGSIEVMERRYGNDLDGFKEVAVAFDRDGYQTAMKRLAELLRDQTQTYAFYIALYYNRAGMVDEAIRWLQIVIENHDPDASYAFLPQEFSNLRADPRYIALARKMNLPI